MARQGTAPTSLRWRRGVPYRGVPAPQHCHAQSTRASFGCIPPLGLSLPLTPSLVRSLNFLFFFLFIIHVNRSGKFRASCKFVSVSCQKVSQAVHFHVRTLSYLWGRCIRSSVHVLWHVEAMLRCTIGLLATFTRISHLQALIF